MSAYTYLPATLEPLQWQAGKNNFVIVLRQYTFGKNMSDKRKADSNGKLLHAFNRINQAG
jgi:hypothetical protein